MKQEHEISIIKFKKCFSQIEEPITLYTVISIDNKNQTGDSFVDFLKKIKTSQKVKKLIVVDTTYLNRHYSPNFSSTKTIKSQWLKNHERYLQEEILKIPVEIIDWSKIVQSKRYKDFSKKIRFDYYGDVQKNHEGRDEIFFEIVQKYIEKYESTKGSSQKVLKYLLEECAGQIEIQGNICYPGELNEAIQYVIKKYELQVNHYKYSVSHEKLKSPTRNIGTDIDISNSNNRYILFPPLCQNTHPVSQNEVAHSMLSSINLLNITLINITSEDERCMFLQEFISVCIKYQKYTQEQEKAFNSFDHNGEVLHDGKFPNSKEFRIQ